MIIYLLKLVIVMIRNTAIKARYRRTIKMAGNVRDKETKDNGHLYNHNIN